MSYSNFTYMAVSLPGTANSSGSGAYTGELLAIDVNHDGWMDLVGASFYYPNLNKAVPIYGLLNNQHGAFTVAPSADFGSPVASDTHPRMILTADFNGDKIPDIFIADHGFDAAPFPGHLNTLLLSKAGGGYTNATGNLHVTAPDFSHSAGAADIDGDGDLDIFVNNLNAPASYFLLNNGHGVFTPWRAGLPADIQAGTFDTSTLFFDADGDKDADLFLGSGGGSGASTLMINNGHGVFTHFTKAVPVGLFGAQKTIELDAKSLDFNKDGHPDILLSETSTNPSYVGARLQVLISDGHGGLVDETSTYIHGQPAITGWIIYSNLVDLNNDGAPDIVSETNGSSDSDQFYINDGNNRFFKTPVSLIQAGHSPVEPIDVNKDGWVDLVTVNDNNGTHYLSVETHKVPTATQLGTTAADTILGGPTANHQQGNNGNDLLSGAGGNDLLEGQAGNDTLLSGAGADVLNGGLGADLLDGGPGADQFRFDSTLGAGNIDTIFDFVHGTDRIDLLGTIFAALGTTAHPLAAAMLALGTTHAAANSMQHIIYDKTDGTLWYDQDGSTSTHAAIEFAVLSGHPATITAADFAVV